jgi:hypothetical protein
MSNAEVAVTRISLKKKPKDTILNHKSRIFMGSPKREVDEEVKSFAKSVKPVEDKVKNSHLEDEKIFEEIENTDDIITDYINLFEDNNNAKVDECVK